MLLALLRHSRPLRPREVLPRGLLPPLPMKFRTQAIHVGNERDPVTGAVVPPIHVASTFVQPGAGVWAEFDYSRSGNPTRKGFERAIADLEGGVGGLAFASGMAATHCAMMLLSAGDHVHVVLFGRGIVREA